MIRYALSCEEGHDFEAWFGSSKAYDRQAEAKSIACPVCGSAGITKAPMAPHVARRLPKALAQPEPKRSYAMLRKLRAELTANSDYVGPKFPEEARKIHYDEVKARNIHGEATGEEAMELEAEGIPVFPLPPLPEGRN
jgi:hypothetical protein